MCIYKNGRDVMALLLKLNKTKKDKLNYNSGIELYFKQNDFVKKNQKLFTVYNDSKIKTEIIEK